MAFNPISIDAGGSSLLARRRTAANGEVDLPGPANTTADRNAASSPFLVAANATLTRAARQCVENYYFEYFWRVPMPEQPAAPLLYAPPAYKDLVHGAAALPVMQCEVGAMASGVLESVPLAYYPLRLDAVKDMREAAVRTHANIEAMKQRAKDAGQVDLVTWKPKDANPALAPADLDLLDTDVDQSLVLQKDIPSLSLLQRPIYSEMGLVPQEQRHQLRVARIVPPSLAAFNPNGSPRQAGSPGPAATTTAFTGASGTAGAAAPPSQTWASGVQDSFRLARSLDLQFDAFVDQIAQRKLGLDRTQAAHKELARDIWVLLTSSATSDEEKHGAWYSLCYFSTHYGESTHARAVADMLSHQRQYCRTLAADRAWGAVMKTYTDCVEAYTTSLKGGVEQRKRQLHVADSELDARASEFQPELRTGVLLRRHGDGVLATNAPVTVYPVEVLPVFPTGFDVAAEKGLVSLEKSEEGELDFLAESFSDVHHLVLPGAVNVGGAVQTAAPHILVGGANLLLTEPDPTDTKTHSHEEKGAAKAAEIAEDERLAKAASAIVPGATMSYNTVRMNTFQPLYEDADSTASYVMHVRQSDSPKMTSAMVAAGSSSANGRYATYDRVGLFNVYTKANNPEEPLFGRYVVVFDDDESEQPVALSDASRKRAREEDDKDGGDSFEAVVKTEKS